MDSSLWGLLAAVAVLLVVAEFLGSIWTVFWEYVT